MTTQAHVYYHQHNRKTEMTSPAALIRAIKSDPSRYVVFVGNTCAVLDVAAASAVSVSRTVALLAVQFGRMSVDSTHPDGVCFSA